jgi:hypothetical protein
MGLINSDILELEGTDTATALTNLDSLERELDQLLERRIAHICELSDAIISDGGDEDVMKSIILSLRYDPDSEQEGIDPENIREIRNHLRKWIFNPLSLMNSLMKIQEFSNIQISAS